jgi:hypothetical protein
MKTTLCCNYKNISAESAHSAMKEGRAINSARHFDPELDSLGDNQKIRTRRALSIDLAAISESESPSFETSPRPQADSSSTSLEGLFCSLLSRGFVSSDIGCVYFILLIAFRSFMLLNPGWLADHRVFCLV